MNKIWWKESVVYQIYPRSFQDSNDDGIGDIQGIISRLDYIQSLGIDVIWICPVYQSPNDDNGYDIADYHQIMSEFGEMSDFDELLKEIHKRGLKLVMDLVVNHTSDEHAWFIESRSHIDSPKRDYYIWRDGRNGGPPNNWQSFFGGQAWEWDDLTGQYYLHLFTRKQPDLNWENPSLREDVYSMMRFWLDKGIDGFRMDVISLISKRGFGDAIYQQFNETISKVYANGPKVHEYLNEMNRKVLSHYDIMTVGEGPGISLNEGLNYVKEDRDELNMIFHFDHMFIDHGPGGKFDPINYDLVHFKEVFTHWDSIMEKGGWSSIFLGNHDFPRIVSRFGNDGTYRKESAKSLALMLFTLRGTVYVYQGEEIGMTNVAFDSIIDYRDIETLNVYREVEEAQGDLQQIMNAIHRQSRDNARTPMQWDSSKNAAFSNGVPWIPVNPNHESVNVASQENDHDSILNFYRRMIDLRKRNKTLVYGAYSAIDILNPKVYAYRRFDNEGSFLSVINFTEDSIPFDLENEVKESVISNYPEKPIFHDKRIIELRPWEAILFQC
jgi:oligo-1,6-glucosidase